MSIPQIPYDTNNVFAKILRGELPCHKVYEDEHSLAFMDVMPRVPGHTLVIPKTPARNLLDISPDCLAELIKTTRKIGIAATKAFDADGLTIQQFSESAGGQMVFHIHFHILPRKEGIPLGPHTQTMADPETLKEHAIRIRTALAGA